MKQNSHPCAALVRRMLMALLCLTIANSWLQAQDKLSAGTQMFLLMRAEEAKNGPQKVPTTTRQFKLRPEVERGYKMGFAPIEVIDGVEMIDAFIRLKDVNETASLEAMGVTVLAKFESFITAKIPVGRIEEIGKQDNVIDLDVSRMVQPNTDIASSTTHANLSWEGINNGLCDNYTGKGVIVGVIDQGIDFNHIAFKDSNGKSRIKRVYAPGRSSSVYTSNFPSYDVTDGSHGTHTSTTAGGSTVTLPNGATYTGMAPESDLFLCGLSSLTNVNIATSLDKINEYATAQNEPCVVNISLGSQYGPKDGTGYLSQAYSGFTGNGLTAGRVICQSAGNSAGDNIHYHGTATSTTPACTSLEFNVYSDVNKAYTYSYYYNSSYYGEYYVWPRVANTQLRFQFVIIDKRTNSIVATTDAVTPSSTGSTIGLSSTYFSNGQVNVTRSQETYSGKYVYDITVRGTTTESTNNMSTDGDGNLMPRYAVGMLVYSTNNSPVEFDCWTEYPGGLMDASCAGTYGNYNFGAGSDDCSIGTSVPAKGVISVGAYVTRKDVNTSNNISYTEDEYTVGDIAPFSSYSNGSGPDGQIYPDITAPGAVLIAGVNRYDTSNYPATQTESTEYMTIVNHSDGSRYGSMSGTSMATPVTTGIVALWLQANPDLSANDIKQVFSATAVRDSYVTGENAAHFGKYGKIDALAGLEYISPCNTPKIVADPTTLTFEQQVNTTASQTVSIGGMNLEGNITATLSDASGVYTIDKTTITANQATEGTTITITYAPTLAGTHNATLTLSSSNARDVTININGTAAGPMLTVNPTSLTMAANVSATATKTFAVTGTYITGDVALTLTDDAGVFSISPATIPASQINATTPVNVTVTFQADEEGEFSGMVTLTSEGVAQQTVALNATASNGGTASDTYLDITKYATIDQAGWNKNYVDQLYQYTEYDDQDVAWLTLPVYGAWSSIYYSPKAQNWISSNYSSSPSTSTMGVVTNGWGNANDIYQGSSAYFTTTTARYFGNQSEKAQSSSNRTITFYVTNVTAVKLYGLNGPNSAGSYTHYPTTLTVTEVTVGDNNDITDGAVVYNTSNYTNDATINFAATGLDKNKIYKVVAGATRGYLYEIGFQTTIERKSLAQVVANAKLGKTYYLQQGDLQPVAISPDGKSLYCKDNGAYASPSQPAAGQIDYVSTVAGLQQGGWDQSNWVALQKADQSEWSSNELIGSGYTLKNVKGHLIDRVNPVLVLDKLPEAKEQRTAFTPNAMVACNFAGSEQLSPVDGKIYWFLTPKPMEVVEIHWAMWDEASGMFVAPPSIGSVNVANLSGQFEVNTGNLDFDFSPTDGDVYTFQAVIHTATPTAQSPRGNRAETARGQYVAYPVSELTWEGGIHDGIITGVQRLHGDKAFEVGRYNVAGQRVPADYHGVVIIRMSDGTARKVVQ